MDEIILMSLKAAEKAFERQSRAVCGNDQLAGCEEFYRGYNAIVRQEAKAANEVLPLIRAAILKAEGK